MSRIFQFHGSAIITGMQNRLRAASLVLFGIGASVLMTTLNPGNAFGMMGYNYWPAGRQNECLQDAQWITNDYQAQAEADLDHIAAMGGGVIRLVFWPDKSGWTLTQNGGGTFQSTYTQSTVNVLDLLEMAQERNIKVIVAFTIRYWTDTGHPNPDGTYWWQWAYGNNQTGWNNFLEDTCDWINGFVNNIEDSDYADSVLYYDLANEWRHYGQSNSSSYLTYVYDHSEIPAGKRGISVLYVNRDNSAQRDDIYDNNYSTSLVNALNGRTLDFVDFHSYPNPGGFHPNIENDYDFIKGHFPNATVILGEFGQVAMSPPPATDEASQQTTDLDIINRARAKGILLFLHWRLWDVIPAYAYGFGYAVNDAKHVMGGLSTVPAVGILPALIQVPNGDMETASGGQPMNWTLGHAAGVPSQNISLARIGPTTTGASTNSYYARIQVNPNSSGTVWMASDSLAVPTGAGTKKAFVNAFVRANSAYMTNIRIAIHEYNSGGTEINIQTGPYLVPSGWVWNNYLQHPGVGSWNVTLNPNTATIRIAIVGTASVTSGTGYLDVDTVSANIRVIP